MTALRLAPQVFSRDLERIHQHLVTQNAARAGERLAAIFEALEILHHHPEIGRPGAEGFRELVIGKGARGYVARHRYDRVEDAVDVLAIRARLASPVRSAASPCIPLASARGYGPLTSLTRS